MTREHFIHLGLLFLRLGIGVAFFFHGFPKLMGGMELWTDLGSSMGLLGVDFAPALWGLSAALAECVGGVLLVLGILTRPAAVAMAFTMFVAFFMHYSRGDDFKVYSHALESGVIFLSLFITGGGRYALDRFLFKRIA